ncbi:MAG: ADP-ribosylation factor-like protein [Promethearchaeota archaeon]
MGEELKKSNEKMDSPNNLNNQKKAKKTIKIVLSGLDNAGKTSMLVGFKRMYGYEDEVHNLKPTLRIDYYRRDFLNLRLNFFDMGGQSKFREQYLRREMYFESIDLLIYLVDIQDEMRFSESIKYLSAVLGVLEKVGYAKKLPIYICFSKADYDLVRENPEEYESRKGMVKDLLRKSFPEYNFDFYSTSIYHLYTIIHMISNGLRKYLEGYEKIQDALVEYGNRTEIVQAILFDHTGLVISETINPKIKEHERNAGNAGNEGNAGNAGNEGNEGNEKGMFDFENKIDRIISGHLEFFGQLEDEELEITSIRGVDGEFMNICYQFHLYNDMNLSEEQKMMIIEEQKSGNPYYANYYFSIVSTLEKSVLAENQIPGMISQLQEYFKGILAGTSGYL